MPSSLNSDSANQTTWVGRLILTRHTGFAAQISQLWSRRVRAHQIGERRYIDTVVGAAAEQREHNLKGAERRGHTLKDLHLKTKASIWPRPVLCGPHSLDDGVLESQGQNLALTVFHVPHSLESGETSCCWRRWNTRPTGELTRERISDPERFCSIPGNPLLSGVRV